MTLVRSSGESGDFWHRLPPTHHASLSHMKRAQVLARSVAGVAQTVE